MRSSPSILFSYIQDDGPLAVISGRTEGPIAHTNYNPIEWINVNFSLVDSISKVVINNRECGIHNCDLRIIGATLTVTVGGVKTFNIAITQANYDARIGKALIFERSASVRIINKANDHITIHSILVFNQGGSEISSIGLQTMSSLIVDTPYYSDITSGRINGTVVATQAGPNEWMNIDFALVDNISKVVINNRFCGDACGAQRIIGCTLTINLM